MSRRAVIFDLDGTLTDSAIGILNCLTYALEKMGRPLPGEPVMRKFLGPPLAESFARFCGMSEDEAILATQYYRERYQSIGWRENRVYPGVRKVLLALKRAGFYLGVATGKPQRETEKILEHFALAGFFDRVVGPDHSNYFASKRELLKTSLGSFEGKATMVGDRDSDIRAAQALHIKGVGVLYGYGDEAELSGCGADALIHTPEELLNLLGLPQPAVEPGFFLSLEGNDGCGKSTQVDLLYDRLDACGFDVIKTREPGGTDVAERIRAILLDREVTQMQDITEAMLYAAARAQHVGELIAPALLGGKIVLSDRFVDSSIAYQGAGRELGMALVRQINAPAVAGCMPDLTLLLDIDAETAMRRRSAASGMDRIEMLDGAFHTRVEAAYNQLWLENPERILKVDASGSVGDIALAIEQIVIPRLLLREDAP